MLIRTGALLLGAMLILSACESSRDYPEKGDDEYDLEAMALTEADLPEGFTKEEIPEPEFNNELWAEFFGVDDVEAKLAQLEAQSRIKSRVTSFQPAELGRIFRVTTFSTLYETEKAAEDSSRKFACGLPIDDKQELDPFAVPVIGQAANGFFVSNSSEGGLRLIDTTVCFQTGRVLHAVQQTGLPGTEDIALAVRLARRMEAHVNDAFDGKQTTEARTPEGG
ncbi:MAG: hypothetical protein C0506_04410 [Anaerolinea sp.]|nr:hypothetical protein [Anaerolinea sp.]